jgi:hypothetical protein
MHIQNGDIFLPCAGKEVVPYGVPKEYIPP